MSVLGIVAEYDPFHNGHLHHLHKAMESISPSSVLVALSGPFKQRGEAALLSPFARARGAVDCGADTVFALPVLWTVRDAEHYALGAVSMLASLGATHLAFGAETADLPLLQRTAALLEDSPVQLRNALHAVLAEGKGYPAALAEAAGACIPESRSLLGHANNILAVCYLRAIRRLGLSLSPVVIPRTGSYHAATVDSSVPSASAVRESLCRGDWRVLSALPEASSSVVRSAFLARETTEQSRLDTLLLDRLRSMKPEEASRLPDCPEGLDAALLNAARTAGSREELISLLTTRRYSSARISRLCAHALLGITREQLENTPLPSAAMLLAIKKNPSLTGSWKSSTVQVLSPAKWLEQAGSPDLSAWHAWTLSCGLPASYPFTQKL